MHVQLASIRQWMFGRDRSVQSIHHHVIDRRGKRMRREGEECPITYRA
jgi:hypothetical protein